MALHDFRCTDPNCTNIDIDVYQSVHDSRPTDICSLCGAESIKILAFPAIKPSLPAHFNAATNTYVENEAHLKSVMRQQSDALTERTGVVHDFQPVDRRDKEALGVTEEGLDKTYDARVKAGLTEAKRYV